jgi:hypothetical protein
MRALFLVAALAALPLKGFAETVVPEKAVPQSAAAGAESQRQGPVWVVEGKPAAPQGPVWVVQQTKPAKPAA